MRKEMLGRVVTAGCLLILIFSGFTLMNLLLFHFENSALLGKSPGHEAPLLRIITESDPPYVYMDHRGKISGISTAIIREMADRTGYNIEIDLLSWKEGERLIQTTSDTAFYTYPSRDNETDSQYKLVWGPPLFDILSYYLDKDQNKSLPINNTTLSGRVAVIRDSSFQDIISKTTNHMVIPYDDADQCYSALMAGDVDFWMTHELTLLRNPLHKGHSNLTLWPYDSYSIPAYIAFSANTSNSTIEAWRRASDELVLNGFMEQNNRRELPFMCSLIPCELCSW